MKVSMSWTEGQSSPLPLSLPLPLPRLPLPFLPLPLPLPLLLFSDLVASSASSPMQVIRAVLSLSPNSVPTLVEERSVLQQLVVFLSPCNQEPPRVRRSRVLHRPLPPSSPEQRKVIKWNSKFSSRCIVLIGLPRRTHSPRRTWQPRRQQGQEWRGTWSSFEQFSDSGASILLPGPLYTSY